MLSPDLGEQVIIPNLPWIIGDGMLFGLTAILGSVFTTWLRARHGSPLESPWRVIKDRLKTLERIANDQPAKLAPKILQLH
jgi:hypothetical protein